jgi:hypothetical protein
MGGKSGGSAPQQKNPYQEQLANIASTIFSETTPLRQDLTESYTQLGANGDFFNPVTDESITQNPIYDVLKLNNERQFDSSRDRILEMGGAYGGGSIGRALALNEAGRATNLTNQMGALAENEQNRQNQFRSEALQLASGGTAGALSGLSNAGSLSAQAAQTNAAYANSQANRDAGKSQGVGTLAGLAISGGKGK